MDKIKYSSPEMQFLLLCERDILTNSIGKTPDEDIDTPVEDPFN